MNIIKILTGAYYKPFINPLERPNFPSSEGGNFAGLILTI